MKKKPIEKTKFPASLGFSLKKPKCIVPLKTRSKVEIEKWMMGVPK